MKWRLSIGAMVIQVVAGCSGESHGTQESVGLNSGEIQGGMSDVSHSFAVGVCFGQLGACTFSCSGVLIAPNLVMTARHCVAKFSPPQGECDAWNFGEPLAAPSQF